MAWLLISAFPAAGEEVHTNAVVWAGLDYSQVQMIGDGKFDYSFDNSPGFFTDMFRQWNELFVNERLGDVGSDLNRFVVQDLSGVTARNDGFSTNQITQHSGAADDVKDTHLTTDVIAAEVQALNLEHTNGLGLVFIADRLVYGMQKYKAGPVQNSGRYCGGAVYVVFFDVASRRVIRAKREVWPTTMAVSYRNFWFGPIKDTASTLNKFSKLKTDF